MENADLYRAGSNLRGGRVDVFSRSSREEDDEEALKWAALERLPTYDRLRKGILISASKNEANEIDVANLGFQERKVLLERLVTEQDNSTFLLKLRERIDRVGINIPTIEVRFENLNIEAEAFVGNKGLPTFINFSLSIFEGFLNYLHILPSRKKPLIILKDVSGVIKPSRMTLLLGPPSSGKTTLLLALAGKLDPSLKFSGNVTYNGHAMNEFIPQNTAAYMSQHDLHIGEMTVRETLSFSARCQGIGTLHEMLAELCRREKEANIKPDSDIDVFMKILGLEECADTLVGDEMLRGISGGQKKRVTTGEMMVGPSRALFMDEISTGLDSSTTYQIVNSLKHTVHILNATAVISLLQPAPETYDLFDDIILLSDGHIVYQGTREHAPDFFEHMGFKCPERKGVADFLQEVTSKKDQKQYWARKEQPYSFVTVREFAEAFQSYDVGRRIVQELSVPFDKTKSHPAALATKKYGAGKMELFKACMSREYLLMKRSSFIYIFKLSQLIVVAIICMTLFLRTEMHRENFSDAGVYLGALFFSLLMIMFNGMAELSMTIAKLPVFYKQRDHLFYPSWVYAVPSWILKIPITFAEVGVWVFLTYYVIGFDPNVNSLFKQYFLLILVNQMASGLYRFIASVGRSMIVANTFGSFALLVVFALGGMVLSRENIKKWWIWGYWISPMMYGQNALVANEFLGKSWNHVLPNSTSTESLGVQFLKMRGFFPHAYWYWIGVGALAGFIIIFNLCFVLALTFLDPYEKPRAVISDKPEDSDRTGGAIQLSLTGSSHGTDTGEIRATDEVNHNKKKGMVLPSKPHSLTFDNVIYSVDMPQEMKNQGIADDKLVLLKGVSGTFRPGVLTALMGVSGAGKTTLMDVLAGRKTGGYIEGNIRISGYPKKQETYARISGYCEQNDIHSPQVTVYESLLYSAWLRLAPEIDSKTRKMFVDEVMDLIELNQLRQALVGLPGVSGLSTEQRKRLTIAVELVANPSIIFMDEPTSGLDARAAAIVMRTVRNTVDTGRTVICTIHQPSIDIFEAFDELFLIKRGGEEIYVGPLGHNSCHLINYFEGIEGVSKIRDGYNPAIWMLEVTSATQELSLGVDFTAIYKNSELYRRNKAIITELRTPPPGSEDLHFPTQYSQSFLTQCIACLWKQRLSYWRNPPYTAVRFLFTTFIALMFGTMFWDLGSRRKTQQDIFNSVGSMYSAIIFLGTLNAGSVQPVVSIERTVFYRERASGMYSAVPYAFAQVLVEIPYVFLQSVAYGILTYSMIGFEWSAAKFFWYFFLMYFTLMYYTYTGMMAVALTPNHHIGAIVLSAFNVTWNLFSGYIVSRTRMPVWWRWYYWACPQSWTLYGLIGSQYGDIKDTFDGGSQAVGDFIKEYYGIRHDFLGVIAVVIVGITVLFALVFAVSIKSFNFQKR